MSKTVLAKSIQDGVSFAFGRPRSAAVKAAIAQVAWSSFPCGERVVKKIK